LRGPGGFDRVRWVALAEPVPGWTVRAVNLDHRNRGSPEAAGQPGPVGACAIDPDPVDRAEALQPSDQSRFTDPARVEPLETQQPPEWGREPPAT
jgi:hypothetical protein